MESTAPKIDAVAATRPSASWLATFEKIAALLAERWDIRVIMRGTEAYTDGRRIVLPVVPENATPELLGAVHGTLDHEAGHVIFSQFFAIPDPLEKALTNALEDAREEEKLIEVWPGCATNLRACNEFFCRRLDEAGWPVSGFHKFCIALYFAERGLDDHWFVAKWIDSCLEIQPHVRAARAILSRRSVHACASTHEIHDLAREILAAVRKLAEPPPPEPEPEHEEAEPEPGTPEPDETQQDGDAEEASSGGEDEAAGEEDGADDACVKGGEEGDAPTGEGLDDEGSAGEASEAEAGCGCLDQADAPAPSADALDEEADDAPSTPTDITAVTPAELRRDAEWTVQRFLSEKAREALAGAEGAYLVYTTEHDVTELAPAGDRASYQRLIRESSGEVSAIKRTLARTLLASRKTRWERGLARGKLNPGALHKIPLGADRRVFRQREEAPAFNTRVCLLVDHSGSMMGSRIALAARAAAVFSEVLAQLRIPFEVLGFTSGSHADGHRRYHAAPHEDRAIFARWGALRTLLYKSHAEDFRRVSGRLDSMARFTSGESNYDGESLLIAARRLAEASRAGERRILFVFSDGCPAGTVTTSPHWQRQCGHLHQAIREIRGSGTELFGIGIESDSVREYYGQDFVIVNSAADLPRETVRALDRMLRRGVVA